MKAQVYEPIKTLVELYLESSKISIPPGTLGAIVECYDNPEIYAVDLALPNSELVGGYAYHHALLTPEQFEVFNPAVVEV